MLHPLTGKDSLPITTSNKHSSDKNHHPINKPLPQGAGVNYASPLKKDALSAPFPQLPHQFRKIHLSFFFTNLQNLSAPGPEAFDFLYRCQMGGGNHGWSPGINGKNRRFFGDSELRVYHNPHSVPASVGKPRGQFGIVPQNGTNPYQDGINPVPETMNVLPTGNVGDPLGIAQ